jgi:hypothetical protein
MWGYMGMQGYRAIARPEQERATIGPKIAAEIPKKSGPRQ